MQATVPVYSGTGGRHTFNDLGDETTIETLTALEREGLVTSEGLDDGHWALTPRAVDGFIEHSMWLYVPGPVFAPRSQVSLESCTQLELQLLMGQNGWTQLCLTDHQSAARDPMKSGDGSKHWFADRNGRFFSSYLVCLLKSEELFSAGLLALHHGQIEAYYNAVLSAFERAQSGGDKGLLQSIAPWKPAA